MEKLSRSQMSETLCPHQLTDIASFQSEVSFGSFRGIVPALDDGVSLPAPGVLSWRFSYQMR